ncbi:uncharacterized protein LOC135835409 isoform X2 [Planococcus citri]|uniref:uncharacterized protein LOC135835409 isoform X2 n=1 Tax=Planococcus citri TaxID=170843 RepID=UPI0031F887CD
MLPGDFNVTPVYAKINDDLTGDLVVTRGHIGGNGVPVHPRDPRTPEQVALKRRILHGAENLRGRSKKRFYDDLIEGVSSEVAKEMPYPSIFSSIKSRAHRAGERMPPTMEDLHELIEGSPEYRNTVDGELFYLGGNAENIVFVSPTTSELLNMPGITYTMDGTFKVCPKKPKIYQLFTIGAMFNNTFFAIVYAFMTRKNVENYTYVFNLVKNKYENWQPQHIISDFETGSLAAFSDMFPDARTQGCWFHYSQSIEKKTKSLKAQGNEEVKRLVKKIMAWPLLPLDLMEEGYVLLIAEAIILNIPAVNVLMEYLDQQWFIRVGIRRLNVSDSPYRTNNHHEAFHRNVMLHMTDTRSGTHPNAKVVLRGIRKIEHEQAAKFKAAKEGKKTTFPQNDKWLLQNLRITNGLQKLADPAQPEYGILEFLTEMAHAHNFHIIEVEQNVNEDGGDE